MKHWVLALLAAAFSLSVAAAPSNLNSSRSQSDRVLGQQGVQDDNQIVKSKSNITNNRETAVSEVDTCKFTIDEAGVKRQATEQQQNKCAEGKGKMPAYGIGIGGDQVNNSGPPKPNGK